MNDESLNEDPGLKEYLLAASILAAHEADPLSAELCCKVQPLTLRRLNECIEERGFQGVDEAVNEILKAWLYDAGY